MKSVAFLLPINSRRSTPTQVKGRDHYKYSSPVHIGPHFLQFGWHSLQNLLGIGNVEEMSLEMHRLGQLLPPLKLISAIAKDNVLESEGKG